ncbi:MAG: site-specific integrase [Candidatus Bathyarchaeia archaeon]
MRERILAVLMGHRHRLTVKTLENYNQALCALASRGDLDNVSEMERIIPLEKARLDAAIAAYRHYCRWWRLPEPQILVHRDRRRQLPRLPLEETLLASLTVPRRLKWRAYFRLLYETGARASEPFVLKVSDLASLNRERIRLGTSKHGGFTTERELPISPLLVGQLRTLIQDQAQDGWVFHQTRDPSKPLNYHQAEFLMRSIRNQLRSAGYNVTALRLHGYRHAFATRMYFATKDLALVSRALGHKNLETTMIYVHLKPDQPRRYDVVSCAVGEKTAISQKIAEGWELALQTPEMVYFKRPRWGP